MKKIFASAFGTLLLTTPALAFAYSIPLGQTLPQMMAVTAALQAQEAAASTGQSIACAVVASQTNVHVNQPFALAWGSVGALNPAIASSTRSMWTPNGSTMASIQTPGIFTYLFTFYAASDATATCSTSIVVSASQ